MLIDFSVLYIHPVSHILHSRSVHELLTYFFRRMVSWPLSDTQPPNTLLNMAILQSHLPLAPELHDVTSYLMWQIYIMCNIVTVSQIMMLVSFWNVKEKIIMSSESCFNNMYNNTWLMLK